MGLKKLLEEKDEPLSVLYCTRCKELKSWNNVYMKWVTEDKFTSVCDKGHPNIKTLVDCSELELKIIEKEINGELDGRK